MKIVCKYDELVNPKLLKPHPKNRNKHPKDQIERLAKILNYQGQRAPVVVSNLSKCIAKGHGTTLSAIELKAKEIAVVYQDFENEDQEYAFIQSDNAIAEWAELDLSGINFDLQDLGPDLDLDLLGLKDFVLEPADKEKDAIEDDVPEVTKSISKLGDIYELGNHRLLCGDSTDKATVEKLMNGEKADMVFTDPPYGVSVVKLDMVGAEFGVAKKGKYKQVIGDDTTDCAKAFYENCKSMGFKNFILWGGNYFTDFLAPTNSWVIWNKRGSTNIVNTFADGELAWSDIGFPARIHSQLWNGMIREGEKDKRIHPTQKPINLANFCFDLLRDNKSVFDGFGGSGSTLIACEKTKRKCFMMELDPHYIDVIVSRYVKYTGKKDIKRNGEPMTWTLTNLK